MKKLTNNNFPGNIIIRLMVGLVFFSEGIQKMIFPIALGVGRFTKLGIAHAAFWGPVVGILEILCGIMLIIGLFTRFAAIPLFIIILNAIYFTKIHGFVTKGFWPTVHDGRADFCMLMGLIFLLIYGSGKYALDNKISIK